MLLTTNEIIYIHLRHNFKLDQSIIKFLQMKYFTLLTLILIFSCANPSSKYLKVSNKNINKERLAFARTTLDGNGKLAGFYMMKWKDKM